MLNNFLKLLGWKKPSGKWDTTEIYYDFFIGFIIFIIVYIVYILNHI